MAESTGSVKIRISTDTKELQELQKQLKEYEAEIERLNAESKSSSGAKAAKAQAQAMDKAAQAADQCGQMVNKQNQAMDRTKAQYNALQRKAQRLREEMAATGTVKVPTEQYAALKQELEETRAEMERLEASKMGVEEGAYAEQTNEQLAQMQARCEEVTAEMQRMEEAGDDFTETVADPAKYQKLQEELANTTDKMAALENGMDGAGKSSDGAVKAFSKTAGSFVRSSKSANGAIRTMAASLGSTAGTVGLAAGVAVMAIGSVVSAMQECAKTGAELLKNILSGAGKIAKVLKQNVTAALEKAGDIAEAAGEAVAEFAQAVSSAANTIISSGINGLLDTFSTQLDLAQEASILAGESVNQLEDDIADIGNALVSAFTPLIEVVIPYINLMTEALAEAINMVGMLFASLSGSTTYTKLTKITDELEDTADASEDAENNLAAFDDLDILSSDTSSASSASSGVAYELEEVELPSWSNSLSSLLDEVNSFLKELDAYEIGYDLAQEIADWANQIDWGTIQETAALLGAKLAYFFDGIFDNLTLAEELGTFLAESINTAAKFFKTFIEEFNWTQLGVWLGTAVNSFIDGVDWDEIGRAAGKFINGVADTILSVIETTDWGNIGRSLASALTAAVETVDWEDIGLVISGAINAVFETLKSFIEGTDWYGLFYGIGTAIYTAVTETDWVGIAETILAGLNGITDALRGFVESIDWVDMAAGIIAGIQTLVDGQYIDENGELHDIWQENGEAVAALINDMVDGIIYFVENFPYIELAEAFCSWLSGAIGSIDWEEIGTAIYDLVEGIISTISTILNDEETKEDIIQAISDLLSGLNLAELISDITDIVSELIDYAKEVMTESGAWKEIGDSIVELMKLGFEVKWETFWIKAQLTAASAFSAIGDLVGPFFEGIADAWESFTTNIGTWVANAVISLCDTIDGLGEAWGKVWEGMKSVVKSAINGIIGFINSLISGFETMINNIVDALNSISVDLPEILGGGSIGFNLSAVTLPRVPELASGAVIRGGDPFAAILGDQNASQTNIETPLETMIEAFETALDNSGYNKGVNSVTLELDGKTLAAASLDYYTSELNRRGTSVSTALGVS